MWRVLSSIFWNSVPRTGHGCFIIICFLALATRIMGADDRMMFSKGARVAISTNGMLVIHDLNPDNFTDAARGIRSMWGNVGNLVWWMGTQMMIDTDLNTVIHLSDLRKAHEEHIDVLFIPTANVLMAHFLPHLAHLAGLHLPARAALLGLGSQPGYLMGTCGNAKGGLPEHLARDQDVDPQLCTPKRYLWNDDMDAVMKIIQNKYDYIAVRGSFTHDLLKLHNVSSNVTGCPSLMLSPDPQLGDTIMHNIDILKTKRHPKIIVTFPGGRMGKTWWRYFASVLIHYPGSCAVLQDHADIKLSSHYVPPGVCMKIFTNLSAWQAFASTFDAAFGPRIHGAMVPLSVGVPVHIIAPDIRVRELSESMSIPFSNAYPSFDMSSSPVDLIIKSQHKWVNFDVHRRMLAQGWVQMMLDFGIAPSRQLLVVAGLREEDNKAGMRKNMK